MQQWVIRSPWTLWTIVNESDFTVQKPMQIASHIILCSQLQQVKKTLITTKGLRKFHNFQGLLQPNADFDISQLLPEDVMLVGIKLKSTD